MSRAFRVGSFVLLTLLIFGAGVFLIGEKRYLFSSTYRLNAEFPNVAGLNEGASVRVAGIHQGTVRTIQLPRQPGWNVVVVMDLKPETHAVLKEDSVAAIRSEGLIGDKYVEISPGSENAAELHAGDKVLGDRPLEMADLLKKADTILDTAKETVASADAATDHLTSIAGKIDTGQGTVGALINDKSAFQHINSGAAAFQEDMEALKHNFFLRGFFKDRGYEDSTELTRYAIARLPVGREQRRFVIDAAKLFDKADSAKLKSPKLLDDAGRFLEGNAFGMAVVAGYAGLRGDAEKNRTLTQARTMVVRQYLAQNFRADDRQIRTIGMGEVAAAGDAGKMEVIVYPPERSSSHAMR